MNFFKILLYLKCNLNKEKMEKISGTRINHIGNPSWEFVDWKSYKNGKGKSKTMRRVLTKSARRFIKNETRNIINDIS